jgi:hypothetical protein
MWLLHLLPDSFLIYIINVMIVAGGCMWAAGTVSGFLPIANTFKFPLKIGGILLFLVGIYWKGGYSVEQDWRERVRAMEAKVKVAEAKAKRANTQIQTKVVTKIVKIKDKAAQVKGQIQQNKQVINADCRLNEAAISAYNRNIVKEKK